MSLIKKHLVDGVLSSQVLVIHSKGHVSSHFQTACQFPRGNSWELEKRVVPSSALVTDVLRSLKTDKWTKPQLCVVWVHVKRVLYEQAGIGSTYTGRRYTDMSYTVSEHTSPLWSFGGFFSKEQHWTHLGSRDTLHYCTLFSPDYIGVTRW